ncbi:MAG TPA: FtsQ-type POTRA domain-containing protein [Longimicrobiales bacterium]|nr:FtsQ-type POTRA domain-containing protein [Longimicrobiales bacterium]
MIGRVLRIRWLRVLAAALLLTGAAAAAPIALRAGGAFQVERVEVLGTRYMTPQAVLAASGIASDATVFDDVGPWHAQLVAHPMIAAVEIERRVPDTIVLRVTEAEPVAWARTPELVAISAEGHALTFDPTSEPLDLPVIGVASRPASNGRFADHATVRMAAAMATIRVHEPALAAWISEIAPAEGGGIRLMMRGPTRAEVLLPDSLTPERLRELRLTLADLGARGELRDLRRVEARYSDQIVVTPGRDRARKQS